MPSASAAYRGSIHDRKLDKAPVIDAVRSSSVVARLRKHDIRHKLLWIPVVQREPARLHLDHDPVTGQENVIRVWQCPLVEERFVGLDRFWIVVPLTISPAKDIHR